MHGPGSERRAALTLRQIEARTAEVRRAAAPVGSIATVSAAIVSIDRWRRARRRVCRRRLAVP